jgi:hypothetical protein
MAGASFIRYFLKNSLVSPFFCSGQRGHGSIGNSAKDTELAPNGFQDFIGDEHRRRPCRVPHQCAEGVKWASDMRVEAFRGNAQIDGVFQRVAPTEQVSRRGAVLDLYGWERRRHAGRLGEWPLWRPTAADPGGMAAWAACPSSPARFRRRHQWLDTLHSCLSGPGANI